MGIKRARENDDDEYLEIHNPRKRVKLSEENNSHISETLRSKPKPRLKRSNSIGPDGNRLPISDRLTANTGLKKESMKDYSVMAVFSREAYENFAKKWKTKMKADTLSLATAKSRKGVSSTDVKKMLSLQSKTVLGTDFQAQVQALLENKTNPHVIAVIEGKQEMPSLSIKAKVDMKDVDVPYTRVKYVQGRNARGSSDNKQSMSVYVRDDMMKVYSVSEEAITHLKKKIKAVGINYATEDGTKYRSLLVHIPNEFIGTARTNSSTHKSFVNYAAEQEKSSSPVVVTSYFGDTNYSSPMDKYSSPSMGGYLPDGGALHPQSSGAQKETHFMQSIPLSDGKSKHSVLQPSTLNYVFTNPDDANREAMDHPSVMQYVAHDSELAGRTDNKLLSPLEYE